MSKGQLPGSADDRSHLIGVWSLVSSTRRFSGGRVEYPYGEEPVGRITYDNAGRMSAQLMRRGRRCTVASGVNLVVGNAGDDEIREAAGGFAAYFGTFEVDEPTKTVIHHVEAALVPSWVGTDLKRNYSIAGNRLVLTATSTSVLEVVWERERD